LNTLNIDHSHPNSNSPNNQTTNAPYSAPSFAWRSPNPVLLPVLTHPCRQHLVE
jgi:hypothetical protein